jgi:hypothetical protein
MKRSIVSVITALSVLLVVMTLAGCDLLSPSEEDDPTETEGSETPETPEGPALFTKDLWGEWVRMDTGEKWYISGSAITINAIIPSRIPERLGWTYITNPKTIIHLIVCLFIGRFSRDDPRTSLHNRRRFHR